MANGNRELSIVGQAIELKAQIRLNGQAYDLIGNGGTFDKVEIYPTQVDADAGTNIIETILTYTNLGNGLFSYIAASLPSAGTYYDKVFFTPPAEFGQPQTSDTFFFQVQAADFGGSPLDHPMKILIFGYVDLDFYDDDSEIPVKITLNASQKYDDGSGNTMDILKQKTVLETNDIGFWSQLLVVTDRLGTGAHYIIEVGPATKKIKYLKLVPSTLTESTNIHDLSDYS